MIIKWQDDQGTSFFDYVLHATKLADLDIVKVTRSTLDNKLVANDFGHGSVEVLSDKGVILAQYNLGPPRSEPEEHPHPH